MSRSWNPTMTIARSPLACALALALALPAPIALAQDAAPASEVAAPAATAAVPGARVGRAALALPGGAMAWASEDPALAQPMLNVLGPRLAGVADGALAEPLRFQVYTNYGAFQARRTLRVYRGTDVDGLAPLAELDVPAGPAPEVRWDGRVADGRPLQVGDTLRYVLVAEGVDGGRDETWPMSVELVEASAARRALEEARAEAGAAERGLDARALDAQRRLQGSYGQDNLRVQTIAIRGGTVRVSGEGLAADARLRVDGSPVPVDPRGRFASELLLPVGEHAVALAVEGPDGAVDEAALPVAVSGEYFFLVALADVTASNNLAGALTPLDPDADDGVVTDGRLAFYLKGKIQGRYLLTAQADTGEREVGELFTGFLDADASDVFRRIDPEQYYPVYGDDSSTSRDVDSAGRLYVRLDWDRSQALWGNLQTGIGGNEYAQYLRSVYGAGLSLRSREAHAVTGEDRGALRAFVAEAQTAVGHSELLGTGGSLYYLRHTDLLPGSEQLVVEVRDPATGLVEARLPLAPGADYEIDALQGRILLTRPLAQMVRESAPSIIRDRPLEGLENRIVADYEFFPTGGLRDAATTGLRGRHWIGEHVAVGGTFVDERRAGQDYRLEGADLTLRAGQGTWLDAEIARSQASAAPRFFSDNGGLDFMRLDPVAGSARDGEARRVEGRANLRELGWVERDLTLGAWWRDVDAGYSVARVDTGLAVREVGAEAEAELADGLRLSTRWSEARRGDDALEQAQALLDWRPTARDRWTAELRRVTEQRGGQRGTGDLAALRYGHTFASGLELYGLGQLTVDDDGGRYAGNDAVTAGARWNPDAPYSLGAEASQGQRGDSVSVDAEWRPTTDRSLYAAFTEVADGRDADPLFNDARPRGLTLGQRWRMNDTVQVFNESQWLKEPGYAGVGHGAGVDLFPGGGWTAGVLLQDGELDGATGRVDRQAASGSLGLETADTQWSQRLEYRRDEGAERRRQWVATQRVSHRVNEDWRIAARANWSDTEDLLDPLGDARFAEANLGFAWRPADTTRWAWFGRYTWLMDLASAGQVDAASQWDQRSQVLATEGVFMPTARWEFAGKLARREGSARLGRGTGAWVDSRATFAAAQARYAITADWGAMAEYRTLDVRLDGRSAGWLLAIDRELGQHMRLGLGYSSASFSDDLTDLDRDHEGWFVNLLGFY